MLEERDNLDDIGNQGTASQLKDVEDKVRSLREEAAEQTDLADLEEEEQNGGPTWMEIERLEEGSGRGKSKGHEATEQGKAVQRKRGEQKESLVEYRLVGLRNTGNTCHMNATLQRLKRVLGNERVPFKNSMVKELWEVMNRMAQDERTEAMMAPGRFRAALVKQKNQF